MLPILYTIIPFIFVLYFFGTIIHFLLPFVTIIIPLYRSIDHIIYNKPHCDILIYWSIYAILLLFENVLLFIPFYKIIKFIFLLILQIPIQELSVYHIVFYEGYKWVQNNIPMDYLITFIEVSIDTIKGNI